MKVIDEAAKDGWDKDIIDKCPTKQLGMIGSAHCFMIERVVFNGTQFLHFIKI